MSRLRMIHKPNLLNRSGSPPAPRKIERNATVQECLSCFTSVRCSSNHDGLELKT